MAGGGATFRTVNLKLSFRFVIHFLNNNTVYCTVGWVNLYQKFEIEKNTVCGKLILPKKMERHLLKKFWAQLACEFAWICEYLQASCIQHF